MKNIEDIKQNFPFMSYINIGDKNILCLIQNIDEKLISYYNFEEITDMDDLKEFLRLANLWWYGSNRKLPINLFIGEEIKRFNMYIRHMSNKNVTVEFGPSTSLLDLIPKKPKKKNIQVSSLNK